jgi:protein involved in polysaccharide export with SLBB domain
MFRVKICRFVNLGRLRPAFLAAIILIGLHVAAAGPARAATPAPDAPPVAPVPALAPVTPVVTPTPTSSAPVVTTTTPNAPPAVSDAKAATAPTPATPPVAAADTATTAAPASADKQAPAATSATTPVYIPYYESLNPGDLIRVRMEEDLNVGFEGLVSAAGTIPIPYLGEIYVATQSPAEAAKVISDALTKEIYQKASVTVTLVTKAPGKVYVYGAVRKPGVVQMPPIGTLSVMQLLSYVDGLTSWAAPEESYILRRTKAASPPEKIPVNLTQLMANFVPLSENDIVLQPDDVFCVPGLNGSLSFSVDSCEVIVVGEVNAPGIVFFSPGEQRTLMRAVFKSGGFNKFAKTKSVRLIRYGKNKERSEQVVNAARVVDEGFLDEDVELKPGDMMIVPQKIINF